MPKLSHRLTAWTLLKSGVLSYVCVAMSNIGRKSGRAKSDRIHSRDAGEDPAVRVSNVNPSGHVTEPMQHFIAEDRTHALDRLRARRSQVWKFTTLHVVRDAGMIVNVEVKARQTN